MKLVEVVPEYREGLPGKVNHRDGLPIDSISIAANRRTESCAEQMEQEWWDACELTGCEWTACTVPMANTNAIHKTASILASGTLSVYLHRLMPLFEFSVGLDVRQRPWEQIVISAC